MADQAAPRRESNHSHRYDDTGNGWDAVVEPCRTPDACPITVRVAEREAYREAQELTEAAVLVRAELGEEFKLPGEELERSASRALADLFDETAKRWGRTPGGVATAVVTLARAMVALQKADEAEDLTPEEAVERAYDEECRREAAGGGQ